MNLKNKSSELLNGVLILNGIAIIIFFLYFGKLLFIPLFFAFLVALSLHPLCVWFEKHGINHVISCILCVFLLFLFCGIITFFLSSQIQRFIKDLPSLMDKLNLLMQKMNAWLQQHFGIESDPQSGNISNLSEKIINSGKFALSAALLILVEATLSLFFIFYMLLYRHRLKNFILSFLNRSKRKDIFEISVTIRTTIKNYIKGLLTEISILILLSCTTLVILGVKYAVLMAFFAGLLNIIPYIGIYAATFLNVLITIVTGNDAQSVEVFLVFVIIHIIDSNLLIPVIVGSRIKVNPMATLIAIVVGELIWGIPGMFLFIPLAAILNIIFEKTLTNGANISQAKSV